MVRISVVVVVAAATLLGHCSASPDRAVRPLRGRFLHITDLHPDAYYTANSPVDDYCHVIPNKRSSSDDGDKAGYWGTPVSECDSPMSLVNATFDWLHRHWADEVDFVLWTGDSARHDLDPGHFPRALSQIFGLHHLMTDKMKETFTDVPIVPTVGNNDVHPHDIQFRGPSVITRGLANIWRGLVPSEQNRTFSRGAFFSVDVIPDTLAVISINSIFFFASNKVVEGCPDHSLARDDPGTEQLVWLERQLRHYRSSGMQVHIIGHVPPREDSWYPDCYVKYGALVLKFQDTIVGQHFGHANIDYFSLFGVDEFFEKKKQVTVLKDMQQLTDNLRLTYKQLKKKKRGHEKDYLIVHTAPSIIPTYLPSIRVWSYNTTRSDEVVKPVSEDGIPHRFSRFVPRSLQIPFTLLAKPSSRHTSPTSPSRSNRFLTPLAYTQFILDLNTANLNNGNGPMQNQSERNARLPLFPAWQIEYSTATRQQFANSILNVNINRQPTLFPTQLSPLHLQNLNSTESIVRQLIKDETSERERLKCKPQLDENKGTKCREGLGKKRNLVPWQMKDLTINSWLKLAKRLANDKCDWKRYLELMFVSTGSEP